MHGRKYFFVLGFVPFEFDDVDSVESVVDTRNHLFELLDFALELAYLLGHFFCVFGIIPKSVRVLYGFEFLYSIFDFRWVDTLIGTHRFRAHFFKLISRFVVVQHIYISCYSVTVSARYDVYLCEIAR